MLLSLLVGVAFSRPLDFYADGPYDPAVPRPETILQYGPGQRHSTYRDQERVVQAIAESAKDRVKLIPYGVTPEGRPLRVLAISSPHNLARLEQIRKEHQDLAEGKGDPSKTVPIVWINECIHGDETASFESGMWTLYNLAASRGGAIAKALEHEVVMLNPVYNPDGHERYVVYYNSVAVGAANPDAYESSGPEVMMGRANHYRFDMNRDRVAFSQDETRAEFALTQKWNPQVYIDQHGQVASYFFPPEPMSINPNVDRKRNAKWTEIFGRATGRAFDERGLSYFAKDTFDLYYPGYLDASNTLSGAIGMTHETDGGRFLARERPDGSILTLRQGIEKHFVSARAVTLASADHASELMDDYATFKRRANRGESAGKFQRVVLQGDPRALGRLKKQLGYAGIRSGFATSAFTQADAHDYWSASVGKAAFPSGSLVVDMAQPQGAMAKALLEPGGQFEEEFVKAQVAKKKAAPEGEKYPGPEGAEFYDFTGWALPYAHDLKAWWCETAPAQSLREELDSPSPKLPMSPVGYALAYRDDEDALAVFDALAAGVRGLVSDRSMAVGTQTLDRGAFLFLAGRNEDGYEAKLAAVAAAHHAELIPLTSSYPETGRTGPGSETIGQLRRPNIAVVMGNQGDLSGGAVWYLMERVWKLPFTPIRTSTLSNGDLSKFTCIVLPAGVSAPTTGKFRDWISQGNVAIGLNADGWAVGADKFVELSEVKGEPQSIPGSLFRATLDPRSFLSFGYETSSSNGKIEMAVPIQGDHFWQPRKEGGSVLTLSAPEPSLLLSGWEWPDDSEKHLRDTVFAQDVPVGRGHFVLFTQDPTERAMWPGLYKTILNAMLIGSAQ